MSNFLAPATVTATLSQLVQYTIRRDRPGMVPGAFISHVQPHGQEIDKAQPGVNLYLYRVQPNASLRNNDLPTRRAGGSFLQQPAAALDLDYLVTFYGNETQLEPQRLLGQVVELLHGFPWLPRSEIDYTVREVERYAFLRTSDLASARELVKFTPMALSVEELSKMWSVFLRVEYHLSLVIRGSVVVLDTPVDPSQALPVRTPMLAVGGAFQAPLLESVTTRSGAPAREGSLLVLTGRDLQGTQTWVEIGGERAVATVVTSGELEVRLGPPAFEGLRAGVLAVQVVHPAPSPTPGNASVPFANSNTQTVSLHPEIVHAEAARVDDQVQVTVQVRPVVGRDQPLSLLLNAFDEAERSYSFVSPRRATDESEITLHLGDVEAGSYLLRVQVDGVQSLLQSDDEGRYESPRLEIP